LRPALQSSWLTYHVTTVMLSYSAFALSFLVSVVYLLKRAGGGNEGRARLLKALPSLETLDVFNYQIVAIGFPLLTIGIFTGAVWAATAWGRPWAFDPKETWSAITWLVYGVFLHTRLLGNWEGTRSAVVGVIGFAAVLFTYLGVNYLLPGLHSYA
jgi:cytochrome c-type biogenesis protein CcsB